MTDPKVLHVACSENELSALREAIPNELLVLLPMDMEQLMDPINETAKLVVVGHETNGIDLLEVIQCLNLTYKGTPIILLTEKATPFPKSDLIKNGFSDVFFLPLEGKLFVQRLGTCSTPGAGNRQLVPVKVNDIIDINNLAIDTYVYLPTNDRYVPFNVSGLPLDETKKKRLQEREVTNLYIGQKDLPSFYKTYAESIKNIQLSSKISETQKREVLRELSRDLLADLFTDTVTGMNTSLKVNQSTRDIVLSYLSDSMDVQRWHDKLSSTAGDNDDFYSNSSNAMIISVLIGLGLGLEQKKLEALAIAALLRDLGLSLLPERILNLPLEKMTPEDREAYIKYPLHTVEILKHKKVILPELSQKIIVQHQERFDGKGFPHGLVGPQIAHESQILHLVDTLIHKISSKRGTGGINFMSAFDEFKNEYQRDPSKCALSPSHLTEVSDLLSGKTSPGNKKKDVSNGNWRMS